MNQSGERERERGGNRKKKKEIKMSYRVKQTMFATRHQKRPWECNFLSLNKFSLVG